MAEITGAVHHVNISVSDLACSVDWYARAFDLTVIATSEDDESGWSKAILRHASGMLVGLTEHRRNDAAPFSEWRCGFDHVALVVDGVDELHAWESRLDEIGIARSPVKTTPLGSLITIRDPDNVQIELYAEHP